MHFNAIFLGKKMKDKNNENKRKRRKGNNLKGLPAAWSRGWCSPSCCSPSCCCNPSCCCPSCCCNPHYQPCWGRGEALSQDPTSPQAASTVVLPGEPQVTGTEDMEACGRLELTWILRLNVLPSRTICLTLDNSRTPRTSLSHNPVF